MTKVPETMDEYQSQVNEMQSLIDELLINKTSHLDRLCVAVGFIGGITSLAQAMNSQELFNFSHHLTIINGDLARMASSQQVEEAEQMFKDEMGQGAAPAYPSHDDR